MAYNKNKRKREKKLEAAPTEGESVSTSYTPESPISKAVSESPKELKEDQNSVLSTLNGSEKTNDSKRDLLENSAEKTPTPSLKACSPSSPCNRLLKKNNTLSSTTIKKETIVVSNSTRGEDDIVCLNEKHSPEKESAALVVSNSIVTKVDTICPSTKLALEEEIAFLKTENSQLKLEVQTLKTSASKLKSGLHCTICLNYYHVPHGIECGHVFCFSCIRSWLNNLSEKESKLECPLCRHRIAKVPTLILTLHHHLVEVLQEDSSQHALVLESISDHFMRFQNENDKWEKIFPKCGIRDSIYDVEDAVARCTTCNWEVVGKHCSNCNAAYSGDSEDEHSDSSTSLSNSSTGSLPESLTNSIPIQHEDLGNEESNSDQSDVQSVDSFICEDNDIEYESGHEQGTESSGSEKEEGSSDHEHVTFPSGRDKNGSSKPRKKARKICSDSEEDVSPNVSTKSDSPPKKAKGKSNRVIVSDSEQSSD